MTLWTTDRPTVPGWYWYKPDGTEAVRIVTASICADGSGVDFTALEIRYLMQLARDSAFWPNGPKIAGPITPPPPAPDFPSTAEALALAVLAGDLVAARALADWVVEHTGG